MSIYNDQIQRIKAKLPVAKASDADCKVFGAASHKYIINQPVTEQQIAWFEEQNGITLPDDFKQFVLQVGNGGLSDSGSGAGPYYGIYPLSELPGYLEYSGTLDYVRNECLLHPDMTDDYWTSITKSEGDGSDKYDYYINNIETVFGGLMVIGTQGCSYYHCLVVKGSYKGRVVCIDTEGQKPFFAFEINFLDWYERWLDEVIAGELFQSPSWFGHTMGGTADVLMTRYLTNTSKKEKMNCLKGLLYKPSLPNLVLNQVESLIETDNGFRNLLTKILIKNSYNRAKPYMPKLADTDLLAFLQSIYWYAKSNSHEWVKLISERIEGITDVETFNYCVAVLQEGSTDYGPLLLNFAESENEGIRSIAIQALGKLPDKREYIEIFIRGLNAAYPRIIRDSLQALQGLKDERLLVEYRKLSTRFAENDSDYIYINLQHRLREYELNTDWIEQTKLEFVPDANKKWYEFWK